MIKIIFLFIFLLLVSDSFSQCNGSINLFTQEDVDAFPEKYKYCSTFDTISIGISTNFIHNLDSLIYLRKGKWLDIDNTDSLKSISGLNNLQKVGFFGPEFKRLYPKLESLDTVDVMEYSNSHPEADFTVISNVRHISRRFEIWFVQNLTGLREFTSSEKFSLYLMQINNKNNFENILPTNIRKLHKLQIYNSDSISLKGLEKIDSIYSLELNVVKNYVERDVFAQKKGIKRVKIFGMNYPNYFDALPQIDTLEFLDITLRTKIEKTFPNLKHVSEFLRISNNDSLKTMDFFKDFDIPKDKRIRDERENFNYTPYHVIIDKNKNLKDCNNPFLCKALKTYPDSIIINNVDNCKIEYLETNCVSVSIDDQAESINDIVYPNPVKDILHLKSGHQDSKCTIYDLNGSLLLQSQNKTSIDVSHLPKGLYIVCLWYGHKTSYHKIYKD